MLAQEGPFAGFVIAKAELLQDALCGHEVLVRGLRSEKCGIFHRMILPGELASTPFCQCYDLEIATDWQGQKCGTGMTWHLSVGAVKRFEVIGPEYGWCEDCCLWVPKDELTDLVSVVGNHRMCCRHMNGMGECRS